MKISEITLGGNRKRPARLRPARVVQRDLLDANKPEELDEADDGKNKHLQHLEDEIIDKGIAGVRIAFDAIASLYSMLKGHADKGYSITTKWDGAPAIFCGTDPETGKFVIGDKGIFSTTKDNRMFTAKDVDRVKPDKEVDGQVVSYAGLREKYKLLLKELPKLGIKGIVQGDLLFTHNDLTKTTIDGQEYVIFRPNTITYAVPTNSALAAKILSSKAGVVFHTYYEGGPTLQDMQARFGYSADNLPEVKGLWITDATVKDLSGRVTLTAAESKEIETAIAHLRAATKAVTVDTFKWLNTTEQGNAFKLELKTYINSMIRNAGEFESDPHAFAENFITRYEQKMQVAIDKLKTQAGKDRKLEALQKDLQFLHTHKPQLSTLYRIYIDTINAKIILISKLKGIKAIDTFVNNPDGTYSVTPEEGHVIVDHMGSALKLIDRLEFSRLNFTLPKNWK
jgi:hypothetical protein